MTDAGRVEARPRCRAGCAWSGRPTARPPPACRPAGMRRRRAWRTARPATRAARSGSVRLAITGVPSSPPSSTSSLNANAGPMMRPSNSGMATPIATSRGVSPASSPAQSSRDRLQAGAWITGTPSSASCGTCQSSPASSDVPPDRPMASTVVTSASTRWSRQQLERLDPTVGVGPQRVARHRQRVATGGLDRPAQVGHELRVPGHQVGPVEHDADQRALGVALGARQAEAGAVPHVGERQRAGRVEAEPVEQHRVGDEPQEVLDVARPARGQVAVGLAAVPAGTVDSRGQLGVGLGLAAERDQRDARRPGSAARRSSNGRLPGACRPPSRRTTTAVTPSRPGAASSRAGLAGPHGGEPVGQPVDDRAAGRAARCRRC